MRFFVAVFGVFARSSGGDTVQPLGFARGAFHQDPQNDGLRCRALFFRLVAHTICTRAGDKNQSHSPSTNEKRCFARSGRVSRSSARETRDPQPYQDRTSRSKDVRHHRLTSQLVAPAALKQSAFKAKAARGVTVRAGKTIDTDARRKAMKAKQDADRKKAEAAKAKAKKLAEANKAAAAKAKAAAVAEKKRKAEARKANQAKYNAMNKTVGGSSKLIKKSAPPNIKACPFANRKKDDKPRKKLFGIF